MEYGLPCLVPPPHCEPSYPKWEVQGTRTQESGECTDVWVGSPSVLRVHSAQSAFALVPSQLGCSQMVAHQPTVSELQPSRSGKQKRASKWQRDEEKQQS